MKIRGVYEEFEYLFSWATRTNAIFIHFSPNGEVGVVFGNEGYLYIRSYLEVDEPLYFDNLGIQEMYKFLRRVRLDKLQARREGRVFDAEYIEVTDGYIRFDRSDHLKVRMSTRMKNTPMAKELKSRLEFMKTSWLSLEKPYLKISHAVLKQYQKSTNKAYQFNGAPKPVVNLTNQEYRQKIRIRKQDGLLNFVRLKDKVIGEIDVCTVDEGYGMCQFHEDYPYILTGREIYEVMRMMKIMSYEDVYVIPMQTYNVYEVHQDELLMKLVNPQ